MEDFTSAVKEIASTIKLVFDLQKNKLPYDQSFPVEITAILPNNQYTALMNGQSYDCPSLNNAVYAVHDKAIMLVPCQVYERAILIGKVGG